MGAAISSLLRTLIAFCQHQPVAEGTQRVSASTRTSRLNSLHNFRVDSTLCPPCTESFAILLCRHVHCLAWTSSLGGDTFCNVSTSRTSQSCSKAQGCKDVAVA